MPATEYPLTATYNTVWDRTLTLRSRKAGPVVDLSGMGALFQVRNNQDSTTTLIEASVANGRITMGGAAGTIRIRLLPEDTDITPGTYFYGIALLSAEDELLEPFMQGTWDLRRGVPSR